MCKFRLATNSDLTEVLTIVSDCQALLRTRGVDQWQDGYPSRDPLELDVELARGYVIECDGRIAAYGAIIEGVEPEYEALSGGAWLSDFNYITLHRLAVSSAFRGAGMGAKFFSEVEREAKQRGIRSLRADTHLDNGVMRRLLERSGFTPCGDVYFRGSHRLAFERLL
ncbi:MAG: GNAT family N-acetyltransferase [Rikenellaceae bacterium]